MDYLFIQQINYKKIYLILNYKKICFDYLTNVDNHNRYLYENKKSDELKHTESFIGFRSIPLYLSSVLTKHFFRAHGKRGGSRTRDVHI